MCTKCHIILTHVSNQHFTLDHFVFIATHVLLGICTRSCWITMTMLEICKLTLNFNRWWIIWSWLSSFWQYLLEFLRSSSKILSQLELSSKSQNDLQSWLVGIWPSHRGAYISYWARNQVKCSSNLVDDEYCKESETKSLVKNAQYEHDEIGK